MTPPSPITRFVQMLSALLGGVWAKLFLSRNDAAELRDVMASLKAFDELFASWKAGTLVVLPEPEVEYVEAAARKAPARPRTSGPRKAAPRRRAPAEPQASPRRIVRTRPVNWAVIPRRLLSRRTRPTITVKRAGEWSG